MEEMKEMEEMEEMIQNQMESENTFRCNFSINSYNKKKGGFCRCGLSNNRQAYCVGLEFGRKRCPFWQNDE